MVPCHRVVAADRALGGFCGSVDPQSDDMKKKVALLRGEGVALVVER